jgi:hypothetical protein|tara:strand:+ start:8026 stop:8415 length:390 start_codon:yes stop_codon:yes gene_type:complete
LDKLKLSKRFIHIIFIITMIVSQSAQAFAAANMPCSQDDMVMPSMSELDTYSSSDTKSEMDNGEIDSRDLNCCAKDCCCPAALLTIAVLIDDDLSVEPNFTEIKGASFISAFTSIFPALLQRPPKRLTV